MSIFKSKKEIKDDQKIDPNNITEVENIARLSGITTSAFLELIRTEGTTDRVKLMEAAERQKGNQPSQT